MNDVEREALSEDTIKRALGEVLYERLYRLTKTLCKAGGETMPWFPAPGSNADTLTSRNDMCVIFLGRAAKHIYSTWVPEEGRTSEELASCVLIDLGAGTVVTLDDLHTACWWTRAGQSVVGVDGKKGWWVSE